MPNRILRHPLSPLTIRTLVAVMAVIFVLTIGTVGTKLLTGWSWIDSFYFMGMIATAQGPPVAAPTFWAKIFAVFMAFVSIGTLLTSVGVIFGPFLGYIFHKGFDFAEKEIERKGQKAARDLESKPK